MPTISAVKNVTPLTTVGRTEKPAMTALFSMNLQNLQYTYCPAQHLVAGTIGLVAIYWAGYQRTQSSIPCLNAAPSNIATLRFVETLRATPPATKALQRILQLNLQNLCGRWPVRVIPSPQSLRASTDKSLMLRPPRSTQRGSMAMEWQWQWQWQWQEERSSCLETQVICSYT
ncbi:hypothetical protein [Mesorhizobium sp.]|uniref:hypothetical protein n=1 Tax=Mesorhizobium sp. TaxID=1871066 RepID=UPI000FE42A83|nr:hypothetical protein [Mesorhizobium sp.]RWN50114.1 MAG: hypothetical protein EOR98_33400 [Mesorhizobium sp.]RWN68942.1 MAG: hypothetical protein EOS02_35450 [Mesorhizobium sp.]RWN69599.1 MAG: hypothetical protein EOS01_33725 [Mesorhizobium sp.]RWN81239.1 MAG: hypothetical protein EOS04_34135 [Mesorhizobium sp.]RWO06223.1 MAG: hypothetical protein EOS15_33890 [Mesorhizobium sp.]